MGMRVSLSGSPPAHRLASITSLSYNPNLFKEMAHAFLKGLRLFWRQPARAWLIVRMAMWIVILSGLVKIVPLPRALKLTSKKPRHRSSVSTYESEISAAIEAVLGLNFFVFKPNCWKRTTVLHRYLAQQGIATTIVFGLKKEPAGELKGH